MHAQKGASEAPRPPLNNLYYGPHFLHSPCPHIPPPPPPNPLVGPVWEFAQVC